jgi:response regulator RpfG family c-di-GMP phosphodiesterase
MKSIVVIDDEILIRNLIIVMLKDQYDVKEFETVDKALEYCESNPVDLIITDLFMPDKTGLDMIEAIKDKNKGIKILAISGGDKKRNVNFLPVAEIVGAHDTLSKPFTPEEMRKKVAGLLQ